MFDELKATIRHDITNTIFKVTVVREPATAQPERMTESRPDVAGSAGGAASAAGAATASGRPRSAGPHGNGTPPQARSGPKMGRNDPCWCGSGKKYKRCHGA